MFRVIFFQFDGQMRNQGSFRGQLQHEFLVGIVQLLRILFLRAEGGHRRSERFGQLGIGFPHFIIIGPQQKVFAFGLEHLVPQILEHLLALVNEILLLGSIVDLLFIFILVIVLDGSFALLGGAYPGLGLGQFLLQCFELVLYLGLFGGFGLHGLVFGSLQHAAGHALQQDTGSLPPGIIMQGVELPETALNSYRAGLSFQKQESFAGQHHPHPALQQQRVLLLREVGPARHEVPKFGLGHDGGEPQPAVFVPFHEFSNVTLHDGRYDSERQ
mmetsp:Transcript_31689/g.72706  ORF Transcript_31689/g.72706 Transcript_31689/m.72706 type:complete len:272 (-) Transcript_31689:2114-2929(-)